MGKPTQGFGSHPENGDKSGGKAPAWTWASLLRDVAEEPGNDSTYPELTNKVLVAKKIMQLAKKGDMQAIKELMNRMDGMPKQPVEIEDKAEEIKKVKQLIEDEVQAVGKALPQKPTGGAVSDDTNTRADV